MIKLGLSRSRVSGLKPLPTRRCKRMADRSYERPSDATTGSVAQAGQAWPGCASNASGKGGGGTPRIFSNVIGQTNGSGSASEPDPNDLHHSDGFGTCSSPACSRLKRCSSAAKSVLFGLK